MKCVKHGGSYFLIRREFDETCYAKWLFDLEERRKLEEKGIIIKKSEIRGSTKIIEVTICFPEKLVEYEDGKATLRDSVVVEEFIEFYGIMTSINLIFSMKPNLLEKRKLLRELTTV